MFFTYANFFVIFLALKNPADNDTSDNKDKKIKFFEQVIREKLLPKSSFRVKPSLSAGLLIY